MDNDLKNILLEIEDIIAKIGNYNIGKARLSEQGRKELKELFDTKIKEAKLSVDFKEVVAFFKIYAATYSIICVFCFSGFKYTFRT
ncbi:MAG: hypothetical protein L3J83_11185 [Proteobacteria bacterium]|nr:hypothetical protein [Pseudomonadota bacterium]